MNMPPRTGPRPLPLHIASATSNWLGAVSSLPLFMMDALTCHPEKLEKAAALRDRLSAENPLALQGRIMQNAQKRLTDMMAGVNAYQAYPYRRQAETPPVLCELGTSRLLDYGQNTPPDSPVVIAVPSLINPAYILDLMEDHSFMRHFAEQSIHGYMVDWGTPGTFEKHFALENYILDRLVPFIRRVSEKHQRPVHLLGYCMGGNLALAAAHILKDDDLIKSLTLVATPWDFKAEQNGQLKNFISLMEKSRDTFTTLGTVPMDVMQLFFFSLDPTLSDRKFRRFAHMEKDSPKTRNFVAIEDWANDGPAMALDAAYGALGDWYANNLPYRGEWKIAGRTILPQELLLPCHIITPQKDRIVPPASAKAILSELPLKAHTEAASGHVNMIAGLNADKILWPLIDEFLKYNFNI